MMKQLSLILLLGLGQSGLQAQELKPIQYVCPPCGCSEDGKHFAEPGSCSACGMRLVDSRYDFEKMREVARRNRKDVAILVFPGVQIIDYTGPYEVFGQAGFNVFLVAEADTMIRTGMGMQIVPHYSFANGPEADIIVVPGGNVLQAQNNENVLAWIRQGEKSAESVMSVCNGAYILAKTGLLDGKKATTFASLIDGLRDLAPETEVVEDLRFVDNGKIVTTAGLSSGLDGSLHVVAKILGRGRAQLIATELEYNWDIEGKFVRAALADRKLEGIFDLIKLSFPERVLTAYQGDEKQWTITWEAKGDQAPAGLVAQIDQEISSKTKWGHQGQEKGEGWSSSRWKFQDQQGQHWSLLVKVAQAAEGELNLKYHLEKT